MELFSAEKYRGKRVCVALSGGIDSVCLLHAFKARTSDMGITLSAVHIEHGIRGEESLRDMAFCEKLCKSWKVPLKVVRADVVSLARQRGSSIEETARKVRYDAFFALLQANEADLVATAHHADDVAETILFRLARGTGLAGMRAISEYGGIVRPLLSCTRAEIEAYADENGLYHVCDSTNDDETFTRNYIRKNVLPAFEGIREGATRHLLEFAALAAEEDAFLQKLAEEKVVHAADGAHIPVDLDDVLFRRACLICMQKRDYTRSDLKEICALRTLQSGRKVCYTDAEGTKCIVVREGADIVFTRESDRGFSPVSFPPKEGELLPFRMEEGMKEGGLWVDLDAFPEDCIVRTRGEGDEITPYHARRKTLKKFLTDRKIPSRLSRDLPVIAKGKEVFVVVGVEISDSVKVTEDSKRVATIFA